ncbi:MAG: penicillin-binding protein activator LpoB [Halomonadaceae bacterium]|nr:MAG: penicillin-binding protein activator LpoB [Halomonadaceae bacterium]
MKTRALGLLMLLTLVLAGCAQRTVIVDREADDADPTLALEYRDFEFAAMDAVNSLLSSGAVDHPENKRYVMAVSRVTNDTMQRIDTDQLIRQVRIALLQSGKVITTSAISADGVQDELLDEVRRLRGSEEFRADTQVETGTLISPDFGLTGKIMQRNIDRDRRTQQVEYYFQLVLTDLRNGLAVWENETPIIKRGSNRSVAW